MVDDEKLDVLSKDDVFFVDLALPMWCYLLDFVEPN